MTKLCFLLLFILQFLTCFGVHSQVILPKPKQIIIAGKIDHYEADHSLSIIVNKLGFFNEQINAKTDSAGNFLAVFESYIPTDAWITYKSNFLILLHPGDSLYVKFDGRYGDRSDVLNTVTFGGRGNKTNEYAKNFQTLYFASPLYKDFGKKGLAVKKYDEKQFVKYLDTVKSNADALYQQFVSTYAPDAESKTWARLLVDQEYYDQLAFYPQDHREANNMSYKDTWDVSKGYFQKLGDRLPIKPSMLISGYALTNFNGRFKKYVMDKLKGNLGEFAGVMAGALVTSGDMADSITINGIIKYVPDTLLRQSMLTNHFESQLEKQQISSFEKFERIINAYITIPFLREPLYELYQQTKSRIDNPVIYTETLLKDIGNSSVKGLIDSITSSNKNKVIYIDFWATWCGPCLSQMPNSKLVEKEMKNQDVAFIYLCVSSQKKEWKAALAKLQMGGQHYFLSAQQSNEISTLFQIKGIPFYLLIDKNGTIKEKGNQLSPLIAKDKIKALL